MQALKLKAAGRRAEPQELRMSVGEVADEGSEALSFVGFRSTHSLAETFEVQLLMRARRLELFY